MRFVIDGDTIDVATVGRVRLLGIDAPEIGRGFDTSAPFGREARARLTALVLRRWVRLEYEGAATDAYNRRLAYVITEDGQFVNAVLVREGLARVSARTPLDAAAGAPARARPKRRHHDAACGAARRGLPARVILAGRRPAGLRVNHVPNENAVGQATDNTHKDTVNAIPVEYASERKIRERNKLYYRFNHWPIWIFVFFIAPGPLTFDLFERGFDARMALWLGAVLARHRHRRPARRAAWRRAEALHHPLHRRSSEPAVSARSATRSRGAR